ncbi:hypothetical protein [Paenibacillus silviterrae]|nr:hypothetical protein [Paenibacillus chinjuensis]
MKKKTYCAPGITSHEPLQFETAISGGEMFCEYVFRPGSPIPVLVCRPK